MKEKLNPIISLQKTYQTLLDSQQQLRPKVLNLALLSNPFLKQQQHFKTLTNELSSYNKRVTDQFIKDQYEVSSFEKLFSIVCDLANLDTREVMVARLEETWQWWQEQRRRVKQRKDLGVVKYKTDREVQRLREYRNNLNRSSFSTQRPTLPNQIRYAEMQPFENKNRSIHEQFDTALKRLSQYKHKRINIMDSFISEKKEIKYTDKVKYPMPPKYEPSEQIQPELADNPQNAEQPSNPQNVEAQNSQANLQNQPPVEADPNRPPEGEDPNQQDLGIGEEPGEPQEEEQQIPVEDKLAPKNKPYTWSEQQRQQYNSQISYNRSYMYYKGTESIPERRMEDRAIHKMSYSLQIKREEEGLLKKAHEWASLKHKIDKQRQSLLEQRFNRASFSYSVEEPVKDEMIGIADEKKYGFYVPPKVAAKEAIDLDDKLPQLGEFNPYERSIRNQRLKSLKHKFANIIQLQQNPEQRALPLSLCQVTPRRRDFSAILHEHSPQKERQKQLEQIQRIKASLGKQRINVNIKHLSQALVPDAQDYNLDGFQSPEKALMNNPFWVETTKKKKKKK